MPAGDVEREDASAPGGEVVADEEGDDGEPLHGHAEVAADHGGEPVGLADEGERDALHLLVVFELQLEEADHLDREADGPGDADGGVLVRGEDLFGPAVGDEVALGDAAVAGEEHAVGVGGRDDGRAVRDLGGPGARGPGQRAGRGQHVGRVAGEEVEERRRSRGEEPGGQPVPVGDVGRHGSPLPAADSGPS